MASLTCSDYLCSIASVTWFVLGAYFFAFFPWVVLSNTDYITEKWRTVRRTRKLGQYHVMFSIVPMMYVAVYAEAQRRAGDSKEFGAALAALFLNLIHFVRTVWGMAQLNAFVEWCKETMECLRAMQGNDVDVGTSDDSDEMSEFNDDKDDRKTLEEMLMVNNTVVDNELGGTDVTVKVSWRKMWEGLKKWELKPSGWLETEHAQLCTMRWAGAYLCGVGNKWCGGYYPPDLGPGEAFSSFFSMYMFQPLVCLKRVMCNMERGECISMHSFLEEDIADIGRSTAYGCSESKSVEFNHYGLYNFEIDSLRSSYPTLKSINREIAVAGFAYSVMFVKHLGVEKLSAMRRYFDRYRLPTNKIWKKAWYLLLEQCNSTPQDGSPLSDMFYNLRLIPFPYRLQMVSLWDECTNWRVLQASAHCDIDIPRLFYQPEDQRLFEIEPRPSNVFDYCRCFANTNAFLNLKVLGVSMETVRTFLGEWLLSKPDAVDWEPLISTESIEFSTNSCLSLNYEKMIWECQRALQSELAKTSTTHTNLPSSAELIMLFILSVPELRVEEEDVTEVEYETSGIRGENGGTTLSRAHSVNVSVSGYLVFSLLAPQEIFVRVLLDEETSRVWLSLRCSGSDARFKWSDWVNASMGYMKGIDEAMEKKHGNKGQFQRTIEEVDLRRPMLELSPFYCGNDDSLMETGTVRMWTGWPAFDVRICKFEMDQWMSACNIDINNLELDPYDNDTADIEVNRAEDLIQEVTKVMARGMKTKAKVRV